MPRKRKTKDETLYAIEKILNSRKRGKKTQYLIKWENYGPRHNSWEPEENLCGCDVLIREYMESQLATRRAASELKRSRSVGRLDSNSAGRKKPRRSQSVGNINYFDTASIKQTQSMAQLNTVGNVSINPSRSVAFPESESCANGPRRMRTRSMTRLDLIAENSTENHQCTAIARLNSTTGNGQRRVRTRSMSRLELIEQEERRDPERNQCSVGCLDSISTNERGRSSVSPDSMENRYIEKRRGRRTRSLSGLDSMNADELFFERCYDRSQSVNRLDSIVTEENLDSTSSFEGSQSFTGLDTIITEEDNRDRSPGFTGLAAIITEEDNRDRSPGFTGLAAIITDQDNHDRSPSFPTITDQEDRAAEGRRGRKRSAACIESVHTDEGDRKRSRSAVDEENDGCADTIEAIEVKPDESPSIKKTGEKLYQINNDCEIRDKDGKLLLNYDAETKARHRQSVINRLKAGLEVERILGASTLLGGDLKLLVKFKDQDEAELVAKDVAHEWFPIMLIDFYESSLKWL